MEDNIVALEHGLILIRSPSSGTIWCQGKLGFLVFDSQAGMF